MTDLTNLITYLPEDWEDSFEIQATHPIVAKMLTEILLEAIKTAPTLTSDLDSALKEIAGLFKEVRHLKDVRKEGYEMGVRAALGKVIDVEVRTPTARDALLDASAKLYGLLEEMRHSRKKTADKPLKT